MFHACLVSTLLCFVYTLRCFYMFSGTNLLTRCHSVSCLFSSVFGSRKTENQYSRNWTVFYRGEHGARIRDGGEAPGATRQSHRRLLQGRMTLAANRRLERPSRCTAIL